MPPDALSPLARSPLARRFPRLVVDELRLGELVSQYTSPLGALRHRAAVKRRMDGGSHGAWLIGNAFLLSRSALIEELDWARKGRSEWASAKSVKLDAVQREIVGGLSTLGEVR